MAGTPSSAFQVATTSAATILAADANVLYYLRGFYVVNTSAAPVTFGIGKAAASVVAATALSNGVVEPLAANARTTVYFPGQGEKIDNLAISIIASAATSVNVTLYYDKVAKQ